jgi:general secretion pathway protein K
MLTAPPEVIYAAVAGLDISQARRLAALRNLSHYRTLSEAASAMAGATRPLDAVRHGVASRYFEIRGRLRYGPVVVEDRAWVQRDGLDVKVLWHIRGVSGAPAVGRNTALQ